MESPNVKGNVAELAVAKRAAELGLAVYGPLIEHGRYDLVIEIAGCLQRVQCKWGGLDEERQVVMVNLASNRCTPQGYVRDVYGEDEIDFVAVYCGGNDRCYLLPSALAAGRGSIWLRLGPARNGQRAAINLASDFEFRGAIAQLEERLRGTQEVAGSSPASSTTSRPPTVVGANEFRNRFGWYMERAAAGEEFRVERRGKPYVRLTGAA
ncbi:MAG: hypothetical protein QOJ22_118 [Thermoleophilaceae bacterium]|nr:hypothetical protein [Thermoleophilaceae bacterium]